MNGPTNPWSGLPRQTEDYVLQADRALIDQHNRGRGARNPQSYIHLNLLPEPFVGQHDASVVLLFLNPGFSPQDAVFHGDPTFSAALRSNLNHAPSAYPFYLLDPNLTVPGIGLSPGYGWWRPRLRELIEACGVDGQRRVANNLLCVELFSYHSKSCEYPIPVVPSQQYSFHLVRQALARDAIILVRTGRWFEAIPELRDKPNVYYRHHARPAHVTPNNYGQGFWRAVDRIKVTPVLPPFSN